VAVTCNFRFEVRPESDIVELETGHYTARVCTQCLELLTVHRRIHHMKLENIIAEMAQSKPLVTKA